MKSVYTYVVVPLRLRLSKRETAHGIRALFCSCDTTIRGLGDHLLHIHMCTYAYLIHLRIYGTFPKLRYPNIDPNIL